MTTFKNYRGAQLVQFGKSGADGCPLDVTEPGNAIILPGKIATTGALNQNQTDETITSNCDEDYVETTDDANMDITFCELIRPQVMSFFTGQPTINANGVIYDPTDPAAAPVTSSVDLTTLLGSDGAPVAADEPIGWAGTPLGAAGNCCPGVSDAANFYLLVKRCVQRCGNRNLLSSTGNPVYSCTLLPNITSMRVTSAPIGWDGSASAYDTWTVNIKLGNGSLSCFDQMFPGWDPVGVTGQPEPVTPYAQWLTDMELPFGAQCTCALLDTYEDADVAMQPNTIPDPAGVPKAPVNDGVLTSA